MIEITCTGRVWKFGDLVSTDLMMPGFLVQSSTMKDEEAARHCFATTRPGWTEQVRPGDIIVAGRNFGCGSSRNGARMLQLNGIAVVLAESISRIFFRNAINIGLPTLWCSGASQAFEEGDIAEVNVLTGAARNLSRGTMVSAEPWPEDSPPMQILRAGGLLPFIKQRMAERQLQGDPNPSGGMKS